MGVARTRDAMCESAFIAGNPIILLGVRSTNRTNLKHIGMLKVILNPYPANVENMVSS